MSLLRQQTNLFLIAMVFLTRIPSPCTLDFDQLKLNQASRYFPLIGMFLGLIAGIVFLLSYQLWAQPVAVIFAILTTLLLTGCFHEDGLADTFDGLGGGWDQTQKLEIMKDSRLGTYGATALWIGLSLKFALLTQMPAQKLLVVLVVGHTLSRSVSTLFIYLLPYVSDPQQAKSKPLAESLNITDVAIACVIGLISLVLLDSGGWSVFLVVVLVAYIWRKFLLNQIQGFTGDTLGATQQIIELSIYATILAMEPAL